jgi:hypothetical protein
MAPEVDAGAIAVMLVAELTVKLAAETPLNRTSVTFSKLVPVRATEVPPPVGPEVVPRPVTAGVLEVDVKLNDAAEEVQSALVTVTFAAPAAPTGTVTVIVVFETMLKSETVVVPKLSLVTVARLVPVMVNCVPPAVVSLLADRLLIVGGAD